MKIRTECPACSGTEHRLLTRSGRDLVSERIYVCSHCATCFQSPHMEQVDLANYYASETYARTYRTVGTLEAREDARRASIARYRLNWFSRSKPGGFKHARVLEVGCGAGHFLAALRAEDMQASGIDPDPRFVELARSRALDVSLGTFPEHTGPLREYDVIAAFHVLEHIPDPSTFLHHVASCLANDGYLLIEVPDITRSFTWRWSERYFHRPHLVDFNRLSLFYLLGRCGFEVVEHGYAESPRNHHLMIVASPMSITRLPTLDRVEIRRLLRRLSRRVQIGRPIALLSSLVWKLRGTA